MILYYTAEGGSLEQIDLSDSLQEESVTGVQSRRVHVVHIVISTGLPVPCLITRIYWVAPRLLTRDSLSTDLHNIMTASANRSIRLVPVPKFYSSTRSSVVKSWT